MSIWVLDRQFEESYFVSNKH